MHANVINVTEQMKGFQENIHLDGPASETDIINQCIDLCPKLLYYIHKVGYSSVSDGLTMNKQMKN